jgi:hypothetical protein
MRPFSELSRRLRLRGLRRTAGGLFGPLTYLAPVEEDRGCPEAANTLLAGRSDFPLEPGPNAIPPERPQA